jgi:hypothetical protein
MAMELAKVFYSSLSWGKSKMKVGDSSQVSIGLNVQGRHVDHFTFKTSPRAILLDGLVSYLPSLTKQNTYRLMARYNAPGQDLGENGVQGEIECKIGSKKKIKRFFGETRISFNASYVQSLASNGKYDSSSSKMKPIQLFREYNLEVVQNLGKDKLKLGVQSILYNQARYEQEPEYEAVNTITPFFEWLHKTHSGKSLRVEGQFLYTKQDQGSFANIVLEYYLVQTFAPGFLGNYTRAGYTAQTTNRQEQEVGQRFWAKPWFQSCRDNLVAHQILSPDFVPTGRLLSETFTTSSTSFGVCL